MSILAPMGIVLFGAAAAGFFSIDAVSRRISAPQMGVILAMAPLAALLVVLGVIPEILDGAVLTWRVAWMPSLGMSAGFYVDGLSVLFAVIILFIGILVILYAGQYFKGQAGAWRFFCYLLVFMAAMLGLVMAGDVITLFVFWEATSVVSFLLVAYHHGDAAARQGGLKALVITGAGGIALLIGLLMASGLAGATEWEAILSSGAFLKSSPLYPLILGLTALGAFTKSAQFPFHIWLPRAMTAPTPASAYLHSATMVKAGIYLMARLNPALGQTELWFWLLTIVGMATMVLGAYQGLRQNDLKALLAYSTICQLGILTMMIGQDIAIAFKALVVGVVAHAMYKSALFLVVGIVDHETGTRDIRRLGGLWRRMPATFGIAVVAALSMAGLPPLFGFLAKETLLATTVHASVPQHLAWVLPASTVVSGALMLAQAGMLVREVFLGPPKDPGIHAHEAPAMMLLAPAIPTLMSVSDALSPDPEAEAFLLARAASAAFGADVKVSLHMWAGLNVPMLLSVVAVSLGTVLFFYRDRVRAFQEKVGGISLDRVYDGILACVDAAAAAATRLQVGRLRFYLSVIIGGTALFVLGLTGLRLPPVPVMFDQWPSLDFAGELLYLKIFALGFTVATALLSVFLVRDFWAILAAGASGLGMALLLVLEPAPDVALVQIVVDILTIVILVLALNRIPMKQRREAHEFTFKQSPYGMVRDTLVAAASGLVVLIITFEALSARPHESVLTPYFEANAEILTGSKSIVGAILVDFRALDTLLEITVFSIAGLGIFMLLRNAARKHGDTLSHTEDPGTASSFPMGRGVQGGPLSPFIRVLAHLALPIAMIIGVTHILYGHDQPGDGFTAGVIISLAVSFCYVVFGYGETRRRLAWIRPSLFIGSGILLVILSGAIGAVVEGCFLASIEFGHALGIPLPKGVHLGSALLFEFAICLSVVGSVAHMVNTLGIGDRRYGDDPDIRDD